MVASDIFIMKSTAVFSLLGRDGDHIRTDYGFAGRIFVFYPKSSYFHLSQTCRRFAVRRDAHDKVFIGQHEARLVVVAGSRRLGSGTGRFRARAHARAFLECKNS